MPAITPEAAYDKVMAEVYRPTFFAKLAEHHVVPANQEDARKLLYLGATLYQGHQEKVAAEAHARGNFLDFAVSQLESGRAGSQSGYGEAHVKAAAARLVESNPALAEAAAALAESLAA